MTVITILNLDKPIEISSRIVESTTGFLMICTWLVWHILRRLHREHLTLKAWVSKLAKYISGKIYIFCLVLVAFSPTNSHCSVVCSKIQEKKDGVLVARR